MWALYFKGAGIFLLTVEDDLRTILRCRCGPYISKALGFSLLTTEDDFSFIMGVDSLALYLECTDMFLLDILLLKTISARYLVIDCLTLYSKGTDNVLLVIYCCRRFQFDTWFSAVLDYRLLGIILKRF